MIVAIILLVGGGSPKLALDPLVPYSFDNEEAINRDMSSIILS